MKERSVITADLTFLPPHEGGHTHLNKKLKGLGYRPHIVIGDPTQREALVGPGNVSLENYCGVAFSDGPDHIEPNVPYPVRMVLMYWPHEIYSTVVSGATFTLREGKNILGFGTVTDRWVENEHGAQPINPPDAAR